MTTPLASGRGETDRGPTTEERARAARLPVNIERRPSPRADRCAPSPGRASATCGKRAASKRGNDADEAFTTRADKQLLPTARGRRERPGVVGMRRPARPLFMFVTSRAMTAHAWPVRVKRSIGETCKEGHYISPEIDLRHFYSYSFL